MFGSVLFVALAACGGGGNSKPDAKIFLDAAIDAPPTCGVMANLGGPFSLGSMTDRVGDGTPAGDMPVDWFSVPTTGAFAGRTVFGFGGRLPGSNAAIADVLFVDVVKPTAGPFPLNTAQNFNADPNSVYVAASYLFADVDLADATGNTFAQILWANSGTVTLTSVGETTGGNNDGMITATNYREVDRMTGADAPGGCTTTLAGLNFFLRQTVMFQPATQGFSSGPGVDLESLTPEQYRFFRGEIDRLNAARQ
jgi:hypothetical protein